MFFSLLQVKANVLTSYQPRSHPQAWTLGLHWRLCRPALAEGVGASLGTSESQARPGISSEEVRRAVFICSPSPPFLVGMTKKKKKKTGKAMRAYSPQEEWTRPLLLVLTLFHFHFNLKIGTPLFFSPWLSLDIQIPFCKLKTTKGKLY